MVEPEVEFCKRAMKFEEADVADYLQGGFVRPFDILGGEPLFRIEIIKTEAQIHLLMDFHHLLVKG